MITPLLDQSYSDQSVTGTIFVVKPISSHNYVLLPVNLFAFDQAS